MKAAKWRDLSEDEVLQKMRELTEEVFNLRFQLSMGVAKNPSRIGQARRDLARAKTILAERDGSPAAARAPVQRSEPTMARAVAEPAEAPAVRRRKSGGRASRATTKTKSQSKSKKRG